MATSTAVEVDLSTRRPPTEYPSHLLGWSTERMVALDALAPGLLARLLSAAPMSRQAMFAAVAIPSDNSAELADVLRDGRAREIVAHAHGSLPDGLLGALERMGGEPLPRSTYYLVLFDLFSDPAKRARARVLRHCGRISTLTLDGISLLEPRWLHTNVLTHADSLRDVVEFQAAVRLLQSLPCGPSDAAVEHALSAMGSKSKLGSVVARLVLRTSAFPDQPVSRDADFQPLDSASELISASRRFRNCLRHKIMAAITGVAAYAVFRRDVAIAEFRRLSDRSGWVLFDIHAPLNDRVTGEVRTAVQAACGARGVPCLADDRDFRTWESLVSMTERGGMFDWAA